MAWRISPPDAEQPRRGQRLRVAVALVAVVATGAFALGVTAYVRHTPRTVVAEFAPNGPAIAHPGLDVQTILSMVQPGLVSIEVTVPPGGDAPVGAAAEVAHGTGIVFDDDGHVFTNHHVVDGAVVITLHPFGSDDEWPAHVIADDPVGDLAVLEIDGSVRLPAVRLGDSASVRVGDQVLAIGDALGLGGSPTVTAGIVSALGRSVPRPSGTSVLHELMQIDAAVNGGMSGGPIVDATGHVVGMTAIVATTGENGVAADGVSFAIPANTLRRLLDAHLSHRHAFSRQ